MPLRRPVPSHNNEKETTRFKLEVEFIMSKRLLLVWMILVVTGCYQSPDSSPDARIVLKNIRRTNLSSSYFPWEWGKAEGKLKRWDIDNDGLIPIKFNESALAVQAANEIEKRLGMLVFDRESIAEQVDESIVRGIIISEGTAVGPNQKPSKSACGHVGLGPGAIAYPEDFYSKEGVISTRLYVNLSSSECNATLEIAIHELGHALGLGSHFQGFGKGVAIDLNFWAALYTLYANPIGAEEESLVIQALP